MTQTIDYWAVQPQIGLGALKFGMSVEEVDAFALVYGTAPHQSADRISSSQLQDTLAEYGDALTTEEKENLLALYKDIRPHRTSVSEARGTHALLLRYEKKRLVDISVSVAHPLTTLGEKEVFVLPPAQVLAEAELLNKAPAWYAGTTAIFETLGIVFEAFCQMGDDGRPLPLEPDDERYPSRTIGVYEQIDPTLRTERFRQSAWL
jgi:hypothetical protein